MAELELEYLLQRQARQQLKGEKSIDALNQSVGRVGDLLTGYFERFGTKLAFFNDIQK